MKRTIFGVTKEIKSVDESWGNGRGAFLPGTHEMGRILGQ